MDTYKEKQPIEYKRTRDWDKKLLRILQHEERANELIKESRLDEARAELDASREIFSQIKKENGILDITDELLSFYETIEKVKAANNKQEVLPYLGELKIKFTRLKKYNFDEKYHQLLLKLEMSIGYLDKLLDGPDYKNAQNNLEPIFLEIFMNY